MKIQTRGHTWPANTTLSPMVIESRYCVLPQVTSPKRSYYPHWVLDYDFTGGYDYRLEGDNRWRRRPANRMHLYPADTTYWEKPRPEIKIMISGWLLFNGNLDPTLGRFVSEYQHAVFEDPGEQIGNLFKSAADVAQNKGDGAYWHVHSTLSKLIAIMQDATHVADELWRIHLHNEAANDLVSAVNNYLRSHIADTITVEMLAANIGTSVSSLAHRYREQTGATPIAALISMRIELAKTLLRRGYKLQYIAKHTGFYDEYHLGKTFKKLTGQTPGAFTQKS